jgi:hypothetical protein
MQPILSFLRWAPAMDVHILAILAHLIMRHILILVGGCYLTRVMQAAVAHDVIKIHRCLFGLHLNT